MSNSEEEDLFSGRLREGNFNLSVGAPGPASLKMSSKVFETASEDCLQKIVRKDDASLFQYGPVCGYGSYLRQLSRFLSQEYNDEVPVDSLILTCGATHGLHLIGSTLLNPGTETVVFVENPTYFIALDILQKDLKFRIVSVPMQDDGVDVEALEAAVRAAHAGRDAGNKSSDRFWAMFYTVPTFHNPTGTLLSSDKCQKVVELARKYQMLVVCDDVYNLLYYDDDTSPKRLVAYDHPKDDDYNGGCIVSNGTFSKILAPGIRIGWIESGPKIHDTLVQSGVLASGGSVNNVMSGIIASAMELGLQSEHVQHLRTLYRKRVQAVKKVLQLPERFSCSLPAGGYFLWFVGPPDFDGQTFSNFCREKFHVFVLPGSRCSPPSDNCVKCANAFRVSIAYYEQDDLTEGVKLICEALKAWLDQHEPSS